MVVGYLNLTRGYAYVSHSARTRGVKSLVLTQSFLFFSLDSGAKSTGKKLKV